MLGAGSPSGLESSGDGEGGGSGASRGGLGVDPVVSSLGKRSTFGLVKNGDGVEGMDSKEEKLENM